MPCARILPLHRNPAHHSHPRHGERRRRRRALAIAVLGLTIELLLGCFEVVQSFLCKVYDIVIVAPVWIIFLLLRHGHSLPKPKLLSRGLLLDYSVPTRLILVVLAPKVTQIAVGATGVRLHLPNLLSQSSILVARIGKLFAIGAVPSCDVGNVLSFVFVELTEDAGHGVGILGQELRVGVATELGFFE